MSLFPLAGKELVLAPLHLPKNLPFLLVVGSRGVSGRNDSTELQPPMVVDRRFDQSARAGPLDTGPVRTYPVFMRNVTISVEESLLRRAREVARRQGTSLNLLIRGFLETLAGTEAGSEVAEELLRMMREQGGHSGGAKIRRDDAYEGRL